MPNLVALASLVALLLMLFVAGLVRRRERRNGLSMSWTKLALALGPLCLIPTGILAAIGVLMGCGAFSTKTISGSCETIYLVLSPMMPFVFPLLENFFLITSASYIWFHALVLIQGLGRAPVEE